MVGFRYLSAEHLSGFDNYKYKAVDTSPLAKYVMQPCWNAFVQLMPLWLAANVMTFVGWLLLVSNFALFSYYDFDFHTTSNDLGIVRAPIPSWVWVYCGIGQFVAHILDGADGKQARRTKSSSPLGELFDHGLDSWSCILLPLTLFSAIGTGTKYGGSTEEMLVPCLSVVATFHLTHWEKYITGVLYLPWSYDVSQLGCSLGYLLTGWYGVELWQFYVFPGVSCARVLKWILMGSYFTSMPVSIWNVVDHYVSLSSKQEMKPCTSNTGVLGSHINDGEFSKSYGDEYSSVLVLSNNNKQPTTPEGSSGKQQGGAKNLSFWEAMAPALPLAVLCICYYVWSVVSPNNVLVAQPRVFMFSLGIVFSNIACWLIISQMTGLKCDRFNIMFIPVVITMTAGVLYPPYEIAILFACCALLVTMHLHFGVSVVQELCEHFDIYCFSIKKQQMS